MPLNGILAIDKPPRLTSHQIVKHTRKLLNTPKVGHAGTLDPFATGLLLLCLGDATRISEYLTDCAKEYVAEMILGEETDTQDCTGQVVATRPVPELTPDAVRSVFTEFTGVIDQIPPMYSAKKVQGRRLYKFARAGETLERAPQKMTIHALELLDMALPAIRFRVACSKGTYIRTLAHDLGTRFGCGAHLRTLERRRIGDFTLAQAISIDTLTEIAADAARTLPLIPTDAAIAFFPAIKLNAAATALLRYGTPLCLSPADFARVAQPDLLTGHSAQPVRVYGDQDEFLALVQGRIQTDAQSAEVWDFHPIKVFFKPPHEL